jgi:MtN3 and saliva related transmembrane protein
MKILESYMSWVVVLGQSMHFIQAWKIYTTKSASDVSLTAYIICILLLIHWLGYGFLIKNRVLIVAEGLGLLGSILVIIGILIYS